MIFNMHYYSMPMEEIISNLFLFDANDIDKEETEILYNSYKECEEDCTQ